MDRLGHRQAGVEHASRAVLIVGCPSAWKEVAGSHGRFWRPLPEVLLCLPRYVCGSRVWGDLRLHKMLSCVSSQSCDRAHAC